MSLQIILIVIFLIAFFWFYLMYVGLIKKKNKALEAFSCVDVQLKKRYDLLPNIISIAKGYMEYEKALFEQITKLRAQAMQIVGNEENIHKKLTLNAELSDKLTRLFATFENYPQLKADKTMVLTMQTFSEVEEHIAAARRFYNSAVNELNNAVQIFPSSIIASLINIKTFEFFKAEEFEKVNINASEYLK